MRLSDLAKGSTVLLGVIFAGYLSTTYVDQRFAEPKVSKWAAPASTSACVDSTGNWKNWPWPNVPALSPKCD